MFVYRLVNMSLLMIVVLFDAFEVITSQNVDFGCIESSYNVVNYHLQYDRRDITLLDCGRVRRDIVAIDKKELNITVSSTTAKAITETLTIHTTSTPANITIAPANVTMSSSSTAPNVTATNATSVESSSSSPPTTVSTPKPQKNDTTAFKTTVQTPTKIDLKIPVHNLGENGTGTRHITTPCNDTRSNRTTNITACVSDPIVDNEGNTTADINLDDFTKPEETLFGEHNVTHYQKDYHNYYNSTMTNDIKEFNNYWDLVIEANRTNFKSLSLSHRNAIQYHLKFAFPFYGQPVDVIVITTGGFLFTGHNVHFWLSATHYIAPLMANFETVRFNDSVIRYNDNGTSLTVVWENLTLNDVPSAGKFSFATTIFNDGDIVFAYKYLPLRIEQIPTNFHPVKIGLSDAYEVGHIEYFIRNKMILEYHQIDFKNTTITNHTLIRLIPLPTCPQYNTCKTCVENESQFKCAWCSTVQRCSSGLDRLEQEWYIQNCHIDRIENVSSCPAEDNLPVNRRKNVNNDNKTEMPTTDAGSSSSAGVVVSLMLVILLGGAVGWILYAYRNPHTNSGQLLIKFRPSQWSWRRGEARYTAATIHM